MIRRMFYALLSCTALMVGLALSLSLSAGPTHMTFPEVAPTPSATLPVCDTEDGAGMALCTWDAQTQGNGYGEDVVSGDCAPSLMGDSVSALCVQLHKQPAITVENSDGSTNTVPNGPDLIAECAQEFDGFEFEECIRAWM